jgi:LysB family phage lysis regulatory protein
MTTIIIEFVKKHIIPIAIVIIAGIVLCVLNVRLSMLKKENEDLKSKIEQKDQSIESLKVNISKLESIIREKDKQREIEETLIEQKQETEKELVCKKNDKVEQLETLKDTNDEVKNWCDQPIPSDVSTLFILGLQ